MSRVIRKVPENWQHPKDARGVFKPLHDNYLGRLKYYKEDVDRFIKCFTELIKTGKTKIYDNEFTDVKELYEYETEDGQMDVPDINDYMPNGTWVQLFEEVSEGTPLSPPFKTKEELVEWLVNNKDFWGHQWTQSQAEGIVKHEYSLSGIMTGGKFYTSEEAAEL